MTALSVLSNAVLVWNTVRINEIIGSLEKFYRRPVLPEHLARLSPVAHGHVIPSGTHHFERASADRPVIERGPIPETQESHFPRSGLAIHHVQDRSGNLDE